MPYSQTRTAAEVRVRCPPGQAPASPTTNTKPKPWSQISSRYRFHIALPPTSHAPFIAPYASFGSSGPSADRHACRCCSSRYGALAPRLMTLTPGDSLQPGCQYRPRLLQLEPLLITRGNVVKQLLLFAVFPLLFVFDIVPSSRVRVRCLDYSTPPVPTLTPRRGTRSSGLIASSTTLFNSNGSTEIHSGLQITKGVS